MTSTHTSAPTPPPSPPRPRVAGLFEAVFAALALGVALVAFYGRWPIWEDQAIYHYLAWGVTHGLRPYVDLVDQNWPAMIGLHLVARLISGADPLGMRLVDAAGVWVLLVAMATVLRTWGVGLSFRLIGLTACLIGYFALGYEQTAQRESFGMPWVLVGLVPWLAVAVGAPSPRPLAWLAYGAAAAFAVLVKPTLAPLLAVPIALAFALAGSEARAWLRGAGLYVAGGLLMAGLCLIALAAAGSLTGFLEWGIRFTSGAYQSIGWPWSQRAWWFFYWYLVGFVPLVLPLFAAIAWIMAPRAPLAATERRPLYLALALVVTAAAVYLVQGKTHCRYQLIPLDVALTLAGTTLLARVTPPREVLKLERFAALGCVGLLLIAFGRLALVKPPSPTPGTRLAAELQPHVPPGDGVVSFGFSPTFLSALERPTPVPFIGNLVYVNALRPGSEPERRFWLQLRDGLADPRTRFFVVEYRLPLPPIFTVSAQAYVARHVGEATLARLGYAPDPRFPAERTGFDVYVRRPIGTP